MADIKWIKLSTNMHEDEKMRLIDAMPERDTVHYLWIRLLIQAGKTNANGLIYLNENIPYTDEMLATIFCRPLASIRLALKILSDFQMIEIAENNVIKIVNWDKHQNVEGMDRVREQNRKRVQNHREKKKQVEALVEENQEADIKLKDDECNVTQNSCNATEDKSNVTVTVQNKRETKNKNEIKSKNGRDRLVIDTCSENMDLYPEKSELANACVSMSKDLTTKQHDNSDFEKLEPVEIPVSKPNSNFELQSNFNNQAKGLNIQSNKCLEDINIKSCELQKYAETITGIPNVLNFGALNLAIGVHGKQYVKMAIDIALKANKPNMTYIDGILKNWIREGYPNSKEVSKNVNRSYGKNSNPDKNEFTGFIPNKPRSLTEVERKRASETLI